MRGYASNSIGEAQREEAGKRLGSLWYKDAVIYELHVRAFADSNGDGIGDFPGLLSRLDYLQDLGITCIWLLPFSRRRCGRRVRYCELRRCQSFLRHAERLQQFLDAAHTRNMQVMIELVINHTSDQHRGLEPHDWRHQALPIAKCTFGRHRCLYKDARIIFTDMKSPIGPGMTPPKSSTGIAFSRISPI